MGDIDLIADERRAIADLAEGLDDAQLDTPSLCEAWTVRDIVAHLTLPLTSSVRGSLPLIVRSRGSVPRFTVLATAEQAKNYSMPQLVALLRDRARREWRPPLLPLQAPLTDLLVHGYDMRQPLGLAHDPPHATVRRALEFVVSSKATLGFVGRGQLKGVRLEATDLDWSHGDGAPLRGTGISVLAGALGRQPALNELEGEGVAVMRSRSGSS
ncbi:MAG: maleylpyruvate isomerase family mycothiol-dependent enzyme [Actinomycetota bacterium]|nr:maleylpyruvate isomerase family mycothiol-dependent enzyme [Actinomycetota bacterium]